MSDGDDAYYYYYLYGTFKDYVPTTNDTGPWMLIGVCVYSFCCLLVLPVFVKIGRKRIKNKMRDNDTYPQSDAMPTSSKSKRREEMAAAESDSGGEDYAVSYAQSYEEDTAADRKDVDSKISYDDVEGAVEDAGPSRDGGEVATAGGVDDNLIEELDQSIEIIDSTNLHSRLPKLSQNLVAHCQKKEADTLYINQDDMYSMCSVNTYTSGVGSIGFSSVRSTRSVRTRRNRVSRGANTKAMYRVQIEQNRHRRRRVAVGIPDSSVGSDNDVITKKSQTKEQDMISSRDIFADGGGEDDAVALKKPQSACCIYYNFVARIANWDEETHEIAKLAGPLTISSISYALFDAISTALISRYLGSDALAAYVVTNLLLGLSDTLVDGVGDALSTVCSHAIGMDNYNIAGQYVQIAGVLYAVCSIPAMGIWWFKMGDCMRLFGLSENSIEEGEQYTKIVIFHYLVSGVFEGYTVLLDINGQVFEGTVFDIIASFFDMAATWIILAFFKDVNMFWIGLSQFVVSLFSLILFTAIAYCKGWLDPFLNGLTKTFALKNMPAVKNLVKTAVPLSLGNLLSYGEWEALTFFAAFLGPAEVTAWGLFEAIWGFMEAASSGSTEAGSIRLGFHLGRGNIELAKLCTWKCLFLSSCLSIIETAFLFICGNDTAKWFTDDPTLQEIMNKMIPMVGIGNILMVFGMISWSLVGAQGRYKLATTINAIMSFCVTIPCAVIFCVIYRFTLDGLVGAVVIGYSTSGLCLAYILIVSDWEHISRTIQECNEEFAESSCSSESSSDEDCDDDDDDDDDISGPLTSLRSRPQKEEDHLI